MTEHSSRLFVGVILGIATIVAAAIGAYISRGRLEVEATVTLKGDRTPIPSAGLPTLTPTPDPVTVPAAEPRIRTYHSTVPATEVWMDSGVDLSEGQNVTVIAGKTDETVTTMKDGESSGPEGQAKYPCTSDCRCSYRGGKFGQLIGKIADSGIVFGLGINQSFVASSSGRLLLGINDCFDWTDNSGEFSVTIIVEETLSRRSV